MGRKVAALLFLAAFFLAGFVPSVSKMLSQARKATPVIRQPLKVSLDGKPGKLVVAFPGSHYLALETGEKFTDPGLSALEPYLSTENPKPPEKTPKGRIPLALWRFLDFFSTGRPEDFLELLGVSGIDANRRGWIRLDGEGDKLAVTLGALGESQHEAAQLWLENPGGRIVFLSLPDGSEIVAGPKGPQGFPEWIALDSEGTKLVLERPDGPQRKK